MDNAAAGAIVERVMDEGRLMLTLLPICYSRQTSSLTVAVKNKKDVLYLSLLNCKIEHGSKQ